MNIKTESIKEQIESILNKKITDINSKDLTKITYLRINRLSIDDILLVDSNDLKYFTNLKELSIENCYIDDEFINNLESITIIKKINFIHCEFVTEASEYFKNLSLEELILNDVLGLNNILISNIKYLTFINCSFKCLVDNIDIVDISRSPKIKIEYNNPYIKELIINKEELTDDNLNLKCKIIIKDNYDEVIKVIDND